MTEAVSTPAPTDERPLRILTLNMQVGMPTEHYRHYFTGAWRHVLPSKGVRHNLDRIAELLADYDVVALQEADAGSMRTAKLNQVEYLAHRAGFPHWHVAVNRNLAPLAQHAIGLLSRFPLHDTRHHPLPGRFRGRGALEAHVREPGHQPLHLMVAHLALGRLSRERQLSYLADLADPEADTVLMGDFNCEPLELEQHPQLRRIGFRPVHVDPTYPSWSPRRSIDHMLVTPSVATRATRVLEHRLSDHLPVATEVLLRQR